MQDQNQLCYTIWHQLIVLLLWVVEVSFSDKSVHIKRGWISLRIYELRTFIYDKVNGFTGFEKSKCLMDQLLSLFQITDSTCLEVQIMNLNELQIADCGQPMLVCWCVLHCLFRWVFVIWNVTKKLLSKSELQLFSFKNVQNYSHWHLPVYR